jgi:hypothetical protein
MWLQMHMLKVRCIAMDQYGKSNWIPHCFFTLTFRMRNKKQCLSLDLEQRYPNSLQFPIYFAISSPS